MSRKRVAVEPPPYPCTFDDGVYYCTAHRTFDCRRCAEAARVPAPDPLSEITRLLADIEAKNMHWQCLQCGYMAKAGVCTKCGHTGERGAIRLASSSLPRLLKALREAVELLMAANHRSARFSNMVNSIQWANGINAEDLARLAATLKEE